MDQSALRIRFDTTQRIVQLDFTSHAKADPSFTVLDYRAPKDQSEGSLTLQAAFLGFGNGLPAQQVTLPNPSVTRESVRLYTQEKSHWHAWELREDFFASTRRDPHAVLDPTSGLVSFGSGEHGRVPPYHKKSSTDPSGCLIFATMDATRAQEGKLGAGLINTLVDSLHNRALLSSRGTDPNGWSTLQSQLTKITNPLPSSNGAAAETLRLAAARADALVETTERAVSLEDCERLALATPGTRVARVTAIANLQPEFPCYKAPGMISVIVLPYLPQGRPTPTTGLIQAVSGLFRSHRVIGTRVEVVGPTYLEVAVQATVRSKQGADKTALQTNVVRALNDFFDPLIGGPDQTGWPFGRSVYRSEVLKILSEVDSVDYVTSLQLTAGGGAAQCGNVCLGPTWLVVPGVHTIQVL
jgi:predicted phage baseplate assembly protein